MKLKRIPLIIDAPGVYMQRLCFTITCDGERPEHI